MPISGGVYTRTNGTNSGANVWDQDRVAGTKVTAANHDIHDEDIATALNAMLQKDGANSATANLNLGGFRFTNAGEATAGTDLVRLSRLDGLYARNLIINGVAPYINQRGAQVAMPNGQYFVDRWQWGQVGVGVVNGNAVSDFIEVVITTIDATIAAGDLYACIYKIEANNIQHLNLGTALAKTVTLSFKHKHTKTGTYCVSFRNAAGDRSYVAEYTQAVSNTEETSTITLTLDTTGTWATGTSTGLNVAFAVAMGSGRQTAAGVWTAGNFMATANQVNAMDSTDNRYFRISDVQLELGSAKTETEQENFEVKHAKCQRYYFKTFPYSTTPAQNAGTPGALYVAQAVVASTPSLAVGEVRFPVPMRATPTTVTLYNPQAANVQIRNATAGTDWSATASTNASDKAVAISGTSAAGSAAGHAALIHITAEAEL